MNIWEASLAVDGDVTGSAIADVIAATDGSVPSFGGPPLGLLVRMCASVESWLAGDPRNVAVVHCMTGRGRTAAASRAALPIAEMLDLPFAQGIDASSPLRVIVSVSSAVGSGTYRGNRLTKLS